MVSWQQTWGGATEAGPWANDWLLRMFLSLRAGPCTHRKHKQIFGRSSKVWERWRSGGKQRGSSFLWGLYSILRRVPSRDSRWNPPIVEVTYFKCSTESLLTPSHYCAASCCPVQNIPSPKQGRSAPTKQFICIPNPLLTLGNG